jgi:hypothetical protein
MTYQVSILGETDGGAFALLVAKALLALQPSGLEKAESPQKLSASLI